jgi:zinc protease
MGARQAQESLGVGRGGAVHWLLIGALRLAVPSGNPAYAAPLPALPAKAAPAAARICEAPETYVLPNGVEVSLREDHSVPAIAVVSSVHAGARHDPQGHEGLAHYVEHLTFRSSSPDATVLDLDAALGAVHRNGMTTLDATDYFSIVPPEQLELALWIEARRLAVGLDLLGDQEAIDERKVIVREHVLHFGSNVIRTVRDAENEAVYPEGHPYRKRSASKESQQALTLGAARWFFARHYRPDRVRLVILGDFRVDRAKTLIATLFGGLRPREAPESRLPALRDLDPADECRMVAARPLPFVPRRVVVKSPFLRERLTFVWPVAAGEGGAPIDMLLGLLAGRIERTVRGQHLADGVQHWFDERELGPFVALEMEVLPGESLEKVDALARSAIARFERWTPSEDIVVSVRQAEELSAAESNQALLNRARRLARWRCGAPACFEPAAQVTRELFSHLDRFDPSHAVVIEERFSGLASPDGDATSTVVGAPR